jgi:hypothetical protein
MPVRPRFTIALSVSGLAGLCLALASCHLVDQRDFDAQAGAKPVLPAGKPPPPLPPAAVTIRYTTPEPQYREAVAALVQKAMARKRDVLFTVTTLVPPVFGTKAQEEAASAAAASGHEVAQAIVDDGAEPGQVEQLVRVEPLAVVKEVHVDVH